MAKAKKKAVKPVRQTQGKKSAKKIVKIVAVKSPGTKSLIPLKPLGDRVVVLPVSKEDAMTASGIILPDTVDKEKPDTGKVMAVGEGKRGDDNKLIPVAVSVGDKVIFSKYGPDEVTVNDVEYYIISEKDILAIIN